MYKCLFGDYTYRSLTRAVINIIPEFEFDVVLWGSRWNSIDNYLIEGDSDVFQLLFSLLCISEENNL